VKGRHGEAGLATCVERRWTNPNFCIGSKFCGVVGGECLHPPKGSQGRHRALVDVRRMLGLAIGHRQDGRVLALGDQNLNPIDLDHLLRKWGSQMRMVKCSGTEFMSQL
jgi:hypothetical protein